MWVYVVFIYCHLFTAAVVYCRLLSAETIVAAVAFLMKVGSARSSGPEDAIIIDDFVRFSIGTVFYQSVVPIEIHKRHFTRT